MHGITQKNCRKKWTKMIDIRALHLNFLEEYWILMMLCFFRIDDLKHGTVMHGTARHCGSVSASSFDRYQVLNAWEICLRACHRHILESFRFSCELGSCKTGVNRLKNLEGKKLDFSSAFAFQLLCKNIRLAYWLTCFGKFVAFVLGTYRSCQVISLQGEFDFPWNENNWVAKYCSLRRRNQRLMQCSVFDRLHHMNCRNNRFLTFSQSSRLVINWFTAFRLFSKCCHSVIFRSIYFIPILFDSMGSKIVENNPFYRKWPEIFREVFGSDRIKKAIFWEIVTLPIKIFSKVIFS